VNKLVSNPTIKRRISAAVLIGALLLYGIIVKRERGGEMEKFVAPFALAGVLPNFLFCIGAPLMPLISPRELLFRQYVLLAVWVLVGMIVYEVTQIWDSTRVFDWADIWASCVGFVLSVGIGWKFFFRPECNADSGKANKGAAPNGGPATPLNNSDDAEGPPSLSLVVGLGLTRCYDCYAAPEEMALARVGGDDTSRCLRRHIFRTRIGL
jgi:hypothetical protein